MSRHANVTSVLSYNQQSIKPSNISSHNSSVGMSSVNFGKQMCKDDDVETALRRAETLQKLVASRQKVLSLNDTLCSSENVLNLAFKRCKLDGIPITAAKFKKETAKTTVNMDMAIDSLSDRPTTIGNNLVANSPVTSDNEFMEVSTKDANFSSSSGMPNQQNHAALPDKYYSKIQKNKMSGNSSKVFTVNENTLRTIDHSIKESTLNSLDQHISLGLGIMGRRTEVYDALLHLPTKSASVSTIKQTSTLSNQMRKSDSMDASANNAYLSHSKLLDKITVLENILNRGNDTFESPT